MRCPKCGHELPDNAVLCRSCGCDIEAYNAEHETGEEEDSAPFDFMDLMSKMFSSDVKENAEKQYDHEDDEDLGIVVEKPVFTPFQQSVTGEQKYLHCLLSADGRILTWNRLGSTMADGVSGMIDIYDTFLPSGELYQRIYVNMYGADFSRKPPAGFMFHPLLRSILLGRDPDEA